MNLAIVGSREFNDYELFLEEVYKFMKLLHKNSITIDTIVSGGAIGADTLAAKFAKQHGYNLVVHLPQYDMYGRKLAPWIRNKKIVEHCDFLLAFWDGNSYGTRHTLNYTKQKNKPGRVILYPAKKIFNNLALKQLCKQV